MKKTFLLIFCYVFTISIYAQKSEVKSRKGKIGITFSSLGSADGLSSAKGAASYTGNGFYAFGLNYIYSVNKTFDFETGVEYAHYTMTIHPNVPPDADKTPYDINYSLISIPLTARVNFLKYCFINGGLNLDIDPTISNPIGSQDGIGILLGLGMKYDSKYGISAFINPYFKAHSIVGFSSVENRQRVMESGFRFGIMYKLK
jgi:hypothetical protein